MPIIESLVETFLGGRILPFILFGLVRLWPNKPGWR